MIRRFIPQGYERSGARFQRGQVRHAAAGIGPPTTPARRVQIPVLEA